MSAKVSMQIQRRDADTMELYYRTYNNINSSYVKLAPFGQSPSLPWLMYKGSVDQPPNLQQPSSYARWVDLVARSLGMLTDDTYIDTAVTAGWSVIEEMQG